MSEGSGLIAGQATAPCLCCDCGFMFVVTIDLPPPPEQFDLRTLRTAQCPRCNHRNAEPLNDHEVRLLVGFKAATAQRIAGPVPVIGGRPMPAQSLIKGV